MKKTYGEDLRPIILVWDGNDPLTASEEMFKDQLIDLYGYRNVHQFVDSKQAANFLNRHTNLRNLRPAIAVVYSPIRQAEISEFFAEFESHSDQKLLVVVCPTCTLPTFDTVTYDNFIVLTTEISKSLRDCVIRLFGQALVDHEDPEVLTAKFAHGH